MTRRKREVEIPIEDSQSIRASLTVPPNARGVIAFAHGSGSSRFSPRNQFVAGALNEAGFATLLADLLTPVEDELDRQTGSLRFDIGLLSSRFGAAACWLRNRQRLRELPMGYFAASTGAAAALIAAADEPAWVSSIVSRGGRPDLASERLREVRAPVLLIVGERDTQVLDLNRTALHRLNAASRLSVVPRATHLFEEPSTLDEVVSLTLAWFSAHTA
ncbi:MAG: hypothetical protein JO060_11215 [Candidatus Eremiobacteraeota bacterium]|nr:hypothetical protein [Candidatus Eremiobacteraeota bacterium]MBV9647275.1 hypothetical protein [Candidatus Eremiobacteraeota bacterium]